MTMARNKIDICLISERDAASLAAAATRVTTRRRKCAHTLSPIAITIKVDDTIVSFRVGGREYDE